MLSIFYFFTRVVSLCRWKLFLILLNYSLSCQGDFIIFSTNFLALIVSIWRKEYSFFFSRIGLEYRTRDAYVVVTFLIFGVFFIGT